jgi:hypothetical protein
MSVLLIGEAGLVIRREDWLDLVQGWVRRLDVVPKVDEEWSGAFNSRMYGLMGHAEIKRKFGLIASSGFHDGFQFSPGGDQ